jgi:hypothetical protein
MPGAMRKLGLYLGLVEDDEDGRDRRFASDGYDDEYDEAVDGGPAASGSVRRWSADERGARTATLHRDAARTRGATALDTSLRAAPAPADDAYRITTLHSASPCARPAWWRAARRAWRCWPRRWRCWSAHSARSSTPAR